MRVIFRTLVRNDVRFSVSCAVVAVCVGEGLQRHKQKMVRKLRRIEKAAVLRTF